MLLTAPYTSCIGRRKTDKLRRKPAVNGAHLYLECRLSS